MKIAVAISGGIDSFYALKWSLENLENITAVYLNFLNNKSQIKQVTKIASHFKVPLKVLNCVDSFKDSIIKYFVNEYLAGRTPNPCVKCNQYFKFEYILSNFEKVVTGHYVNIKKVNNKFFISKGSDRLKEQSYFLARVNQNILNSIIFPLGNKNKNEVVNEVCLEYKQFGNNKESQEICFIKNNDYKSFIKDYTTINNQKGYIKNLDGKVLGKHNGFYNFTIGQRKGLNIAMGEPYYVLKVEPSTNIVYAGPKEKTFNKSFEIKNVLWYESPDKFSSLKVKVRYRTSEKSCMISGNRITLLEKEQSVTPGQLAVFYSNNLIIGSGWIENAD